MAYKKRNVINEHIIIIKFKRIYIQTLITIKYELSWGIRTIIRFKCYRRNGDFKED